MGKRKLITDEDIEKMKQLAEEGYTNKEIGESTGFTSGTVATKLSKTNYKRPTSPHKYNVGEIVNGSVRIVKQIRMGKKNIKAYLVKSLAYPDDKNDYEMSEGSLSRGRGCSYISGQRVIYENSLYYIERVRKYIPTENIEFCKTIPPHYTKEITFVCNNCGKEKHTKPSNIVNRESFPCNLCSGGTKYPELWFMGMFGAKGIEYEYQVTHDNFDLPYDFRINLNGEVFYLEIQGLQHFQEVKHYGGAKGFGRQKASDLAKKNYCKQFGLNLIIIDARESTFDFIREQVNKCEFLPNIIDDNIPLMLEIMQKNKRHPVREYIDLYNYGFTTYDIADMYDVLYSVVIRFLRKNNIEISKSKKVRCITTGKEFDSITKASEEYNINRGNINTHLSGERKSAGKHHITGEKLTWEYVS